MTYIEARLEVVRDGLAHCLRKMNKPLEVCDLYETQAQLQRTLFNLHLLIGAKEQAEWFPPINTKESP